MLKKYIPQPKPISFNWFYAYMALSFCGSNSAHLVIEKLEDRNPAVREAAWQTFLPSALSSTSTNEAIALALTALKDNDPMVCRAAALCLNGLGAAASNAVPGLIPLLTRSEVGRGPQIPHVPLHAIAAVALGKIGPAAASAVPALTNLLAMGDSYARMSAAIALWRITLNENPYLDIISNELPTAEWNARYTISSFLQAMGPQAESAFPLLVNELARDNAAPSPSPIDTILKAPIINALRAIDPEAAAKLFGEPHPPEK